MPCTHPFDITLLCLLQAFLLPALTHSLLPPPRGLLSLWFARCRHSTEEFEKNAEYRQLLVRALHEFGVKFADLAAVIVPHLMEFLCDDEAESTAVGTGASAPSGSSRGKSAAMDVILFVREAFEKLPDLRADMLEKLLDNFLAIKNEEVCRATLWIIGEYANTPDAIKGAMAKLR